MRWMLFVLCLLSWPACVLAQAEKAESTDLTKGDKEFLALGEEVQKSYETYLKDAEKLTDPKAKEKFLQENDPLLGYLTKLAELEIKHHGTPAGLMIARELISMGGNGETPDNPRDLARRKMLATLPDYSDHELLPQLLRSFDSGVNPDPATEACLRAMVNSPKATELNREFAKFMLASWTIFVRDDRDYIEKRLKELESGEKEAWENERSGLEAGLKFVLPREKIAVLEKEALETLAILNASGKELTFPAIKYADQQGKILRVDSESTKPRATLKGLVTGVLFKENHLRPGKPAPDLDLELTTGKKWSLADQKGKCVVIQFSFKGCGPCEAMYPDLRDLAKQFPETLSIVSIMADETREVTAEAVESGKVTWGAYFDGQQGPICRKWSVRAFPTLYVIDRNGKVVEDVGQGQRMKTKIAELCK